MNVSANCMKRKKVLITSSLAFRIILIKENADKPRVYIGALCVCVGVNVCVLRIIAKTN